MKNPRKIKLVNLYIIFVIVVAFVAVLVIAGLNTSTRNMETMQRITEEYITSQDAVNDMRDASNYLTEESREYVISGDIKHLKNYLTEVNETKRRDNALEVLKDYHEDSEAFIALQEALKSSNELAEIEMQAMCLAAHAYGMSDADINTYFAGVNLDADLMAQTTDDMRQTAMEMLFDESYDQYKTSIMQSVMSSTEGIIETLREQQLVSYQNTARYLSGEHAMVFVILAAIFVILLLSALLVIVPLNRGVEIIRKKEFLPVRGSAEYAYMAQAYNQMLEKTHEHQEQLSYDATHDELTGLYNRKMFEQTRAEFSEEDTAMLLVDVDYFKSINDTYGHDIGDQVLKRVANILMHCFRSEDYVCRVGGDEFAVIMVHMTAELSHVVMTKIAMVQSRILEKSDLPDVTLSIGVAFSEGCGAEELYRKADTALYEVKKKGRNGFAFFEESFSVESDLEM